MKKKFRNIFSVFLSILMFLSVFFDAFGNMEKTFANSDIITDIQLDKEEIEHAQSFNVKVRFGGWGTTVYEGQQETIYLSSDKVNITLPSGEIPLKDELGNNLGTVSFERDPQKTSGRAIITFNKRASELDNISGTTNFTVEGHYNGDLNRDGEGRIILRSGRIYKEVEVIYKSGGITTDEIYSKKGTWSTHHPEGNRVNWIFNFNAAKKSTDGKSYSFNVSDILSEDMKWDIEHIKVNPYAVRIQSKTSEKWDWNLSIDKAKEAGFDIEINGQNLTIKVPNNVRLDRRTIDPLNERKIEIWLRAKVKDEIMENKNIPEVTNDSEVGSQGLSKLKWEKSQRTIKESASVKIQRKGGSATGTEPGELKIKKVIKDTKTPIEGVKFKLSRPDGRAVRVREEGTGYVYKNSITLTTNHEGIASAKGLEYAEYTLEEIEVPEWIKFDKNNHFKKAFVISGYDIEGKEYTIENEKKKINVNIKKKWLDSLGKTLNEHPETKVRLYQNNNPIQGEVTLKRNNLEHIWRDLDFSDDQGNKYEYSVKEVGENNKKIELEGKIFNVDYSKEFTESNENFTIINKEDKPNLKEGKGKFIINKTDGKKALDGAVFELKNNSNQSVIVPSSGEGSSKISYGNLDPGTYTLKEKTPPAGYEKTNQEWEVTVDKDGFTKVEEKSSKSKKSRSQSSSERGAEKQFRSADLSSYILPGSVRGLLFDSNNGSNLENINLARAGELDINQLYPGYNYPSPSFSYSEKDVTKNKRKNERYKSTNEGDWYRYRGKDKYHDTDVAEVNKYLVPTDKPGEYEVHLKVRGNTVEEKNSLGIVIVYDHSGSMSLSPNGWNSKSRFEVAKEATEGFLREILNPNNNNVQAALVSFGGDLFDGQNHKEGNYKDYSHFEFTNDSKNIIDKMPKSPTKPDSQKAGTYTASGLKKAEELLRNSHFDKKVIITITDGIPTFSPAVEDTRIPKLNYSQKYGGGYSFKLKNKHKNEEYPSNDGIQIKNHGQATIYQAQINKKAGIDMYTVGILIAAEKDASEEDAHNVMRNIANQGKYFNSEAIGDIKKNLDKILVDLNHKTVNEGEINDPLGSQVEYSDSGYELKKYRNGREAPDVSTRSRVEYDNLNRKFKVSNLTLGKDESCELIYKVNLKIEDSNFVSENMYPTNGEATLKPYGKKDVNWRFPEPAISAKLRDIKLTKKWRKQSGSKPQGGTVTFQLQRKKATEDDSKYQDVSSQNVTKNISDGDFEHTFKNLPPFNNKGEIYNYRVIETNIPEGYEPTTHEEGDNITITNKEIPEITVVNHPVKRYGKFIIEKEDDKGKPLGGAGFKLTNDKTGKQVKSTSGEGTSKITYEKLEEGSYTLEEVSPPDGYIKTTDKWTVTVENDGFTRVEKSTKSSKSYSLDSSEESGKRRFRSASPSSYNIPRSLKSLYRGNIIPVSRSGNSMDGLYNENAQPNPSFTYQDSSSGRTGEKYKNPKITNGFYNYKGNFKGKSVDVAGVNKYLEPTKKPGEYIVHLKVKGNTIKEENKIGVVVVYDNSGSMKGKKFRVAQNATKNFIRTLLKDNTNKNIEAALVSFNGYVLENATIDFTNSYEEFIAALPKDPDHGTNTTAGLVKADDLFEGKDFDKKIVVLITDGRPTYHPKVTRIIKSGEFSPRAEFSSSSKERKGDGRNYTLRKYKYRVGEDSIDNNGDPALYACNNMKSKGIEIHTVGVELQKEESDLSPEKARELMGKMASRDDYYYDTAEVDLLSDNLTKILEKIDMDTIEYGSIEDQIGEKVIFEENSYDIKGFKGGVPDNDITRYVYKNYDKNNKKLIISNLNLGENERCEITYKVHLDIENGNIKSGKFYETNKIATLMPHWQHNNIKWKFPEPAISATLKNIKLKKSWQNQSVKTSNEEVTFQLQRKIKGQGDGEYKDVANKYIRKKIKDISNTEFTHTFKDLIPFNNNGEIYEYRVIEKGVPNGYDPIIEYDENGNTDIINREIPVVKIKNNPNEIEFTKVNSIGTPLAGATFKLQKEDSHTWKDVEKYKNITSGNLKAKIRMEKLAPGDYRLIETKAPQGFITPDENNPVATFTVDNNGKISSKSTNNNDENKIVNYPQAVDLTLFKYEGNESAQRPLKGAKFKIYRNNSRPNKNNPIEEVIINGVSEWTTKDNGEVTINGLTNGIYWLRETKPPEGYDRIQGFIGKIIVENGNISYDKQPLYNDKGTKPENIQDNKIELKQNTLEIQNKKNYIELEKRYIDNSGTEQPLNGAKFGLYKEVNNSYVQYLRENKHYIVSSGHTGTTGQFRFEKLEPGEYAVREEKAPLGFEKIDGNIIKFTVNENGDYTDIENIQFNKISNNVCKIINKRKPMKFYIIKTDSNGLKLSDGILGVKIERLKFNNGKDKKEFNLASDYVDYSSSEGLKSGLEIEVPLDTKTDTYILKETRAPQGFQLSNKEYKIRIDSENRRIKLLGDKEHAEQILYEENSSNSTIQLGSPIEIKNKRVEYPNTGGLGTLLFTVIGGGLMVISSIFIMRKKRRI